uniref:C2H2-type domain-containing protein n=1 Tax=Heterorhabditis bacteriophora TaxID=37862 RepID=A0A1I7X1W5_HETBA
MFPHETYEYVDGTNVPRPTEEIEVTLCLYIYIYIYKATLCLLFMCTSLLVETSSNQMVIHQEQRDVMLNSGVDEIVVDEGFYLKLYSTMFNIFISYYLNFRVWMLISQVHTIVASQWFMNASIVVESINILVKFRYVCMIGGCTQRFVSGALLNIHQQTKHFMTKKYVCMKGCGRYFASARNQRNHEDRCLYNKDAANDIDDAIYQQLMYNDEEDEPEDTLRATQSQYVVDDPETLIEAVDMNISAHPQFLLH